MGYAQRLAGLKKLVANASASTAEAHDLIKKPDRWRPIRPQHPMDGIGTGQTRPHIHPVIMEWTSFFSGLIRCSSISASHPLIRLTFAIVRVLPLADLVNIPELAAVLQQFKGLRPPQSGPFLNVLRTVRLSI